ncbi:MAG: hypothetical protein HC933_03820 [Pleurocapsa sp. SU_196_0]|nr:hypothetical protein [Pleurocapsa sp. SU_196_0]
MGTDLELELIEGMLEEIAETAKPARADRIRELREKLLTAKLLRRVPKLEPRLVIWQDPRFWTLLTALLALIAAVFGVQIPREILNGGK